MIHPFFFHYIAIPNRFPNDLCYISLGERIMKYGIVDIGSNTVVLIIYNTETPVPEILLHKSAPVHLVGYIEDGHMKQEGIERTCETLREYRRIIDEMKADDYAAFITEPARNIDNRDEMLKAFREEGFDVQPLSGREEAECDFEGSRLYVPQITTGNAFDIGGGSTELIAFRDNEIIEAVSIPYGCVRLSSMEVRNEVTDPIIREAFEQHPLLTSIPSGTIVGIGGTCRAAGLLCDAVYGTGKTMTRKELGEIYRKLHDMDPEMTELMHKVVSKGRWDVFMPGVNMLLSILWAYNADTVVISEGCVREGFLLRQMKKQCG